MNKSLKQNFVKISGGVTAPSGYKASGVRAGIKYSRPDIALLYSEKPAQAAAVYTSNLVKGAHIGLCKSHLKNGQVSAVIVNSGCANACVGKTGPADAKRMASLTAKSLALPVSDVLVCSTGTIGITLPMDKIAKGITDAVSELSSNGGAKAARAIMTTDTRPKECAVELEIDGRKMRIGGMAKGAGMIEPNMATMLGFITTDAAVPASALKSVLKQAVDLSFNRVSIDGDQSCNDTVIIMANGTADSKPLTQGHREWNKFRQALEYVCMSLAVMMVKDGEGATKFVTVNIKGARSQADARKAARSVCNSMLVKTSWFGGDPNWGRIIDAAGYSGAKFNPSKTSIAFNGVPVVREGQRSKDVPLKKLEAIYRKKEINIDIDLHAGRASYFVFTCDCSCDYVKINSEYMT